MYELFRRCCDFRHCPLLQEHLFETSASYLLVLVDPPSLYHPLNVGFTNRMLCCTTPDMCVNVSGNHKGYGRREGDVNRYTAIVIYVNNYESLIVISLRYTLGRYVT